MADQSSPSGQPGPAPASPPAQAVPRRHPQFPYGFPPYPPPQPVGGAAPVAPNPLPVNPPPPSAPGGASNQDLAPQDSLLYPGAPQTLIDAVRSGVVLKAARWGIPDFFITLALWLVFAVLAAVIAGAALGDADMTTGPAILLALSLPWIGLAGWPLWVAYSKGNGPVIDFGLTKRASDLGWGLLYGIGALVAAGIIAAITTAIFGDFDSAAGEVGEQLSMGPLIIFALLVGIGAPIVEELAFRGLLFGALAKRNLAPWVSIVVSAAAFSLFHFEPIRIPLLLATGLILGLARYHTRSTTVPIIAHAVNNLPAAVVFVFMP